MHIYIYMHISSYKTGKPLTLHVLTPNAKPHVALAKAACNDQREPPSVTRIGNFAAGMDFVHQQFYQHKKNPKGFLLPVSPPQKMKLKYECNKILEVKWRLPPTPGDDRHLPLPNFAQQFLLTTSMMPWQNGSWMLNIAGWNITISNRKCIFKGSIAMLDYRSVTCKNRANTSKPCHHPWPAWKSWPLSHLLFSLIQVQTESNTMQDPLIPLEWICRETSSDTTKPSKNARYQPTLELEKVWWIPSSALVPQQIT